VRSCADEANGGGGRLDQGFVRNTPVHFDYSIIIFHVVLIIGAKSVIQGLCRPPLHSFDATTRHSFTHPWPKHESRSGFPIDLEFVLDFDSRKSDLPPGERCRHFSACHVRSFLPWNVKLGGGFLGLVTRRSSGSFQYPFSRQREPFRTNLIQTLHRALQFDAPSFGFQRLVGG